MRNIFLRFRPFLIFLLYTGMMFFTEHASSQTVTSSTVAESRFPMEISPDNQKGNNPRFKIYSSKTHDTIQISNLPEWENYRWELKRRMEDIMGPLPHRDVKKEVKYRIIDTLITEKYTRLHISIQTTSAEEIPALLYMPHRSSISGKLPAILALHPTGEAGKRIVDGDGLENRAYARELAERGYIVIAPDYPSFGELSKFDFKKSRYASGTIAGIFYHMTCVDLLTTLPQVDPNRIGAIGHSLGGHNAIFVGAFDERLQVVVSSCGWTPMEHYDIGPVAQEIYGGRLGPWAQDRYMPLLKSKYNLDENRIPVDFHEMIALLAPRGFFSNSPLQDSNFDVEGVKKGITMVHEIYSAMDVTDRLQVRYPEAKHDFPNHVRKEAYEFIDSILNHVPNIQVLK